jgi:hypothetical protein
MRLINHVRSLEFHDPGVLSKFTILSQPRIKGSDDKKFYLRLTHLRNSQ